MTKKKNEPNDYNYDEALLTRLAWAGVGWISGAIFAFLVTSLFLM